MGRSKRTEVRGKFEDLTALEQRVFRSMLNIPQPTDWLVVTYGPNVIHVCENLKSRGYIAYTEPRARWEVTGPGREEWNRYRGRSGVRIENYPLRW